MNIKPLYDRVVIKPFPKEERSRGGIILPDSSRENLIMGEVISLGEGRITESGNVYSPRLHVGDKVLYVKNSGIPVDLDGVDHVVIREGDVIGIITETISSNKNMEKEK